MDPSSQSLKAGYILVLVMLLCAILSLIVLSAGQHLLAAVRVVSQQQRYCTIVQERKSEIYTCEMANAALTPYAFIPDSLQIDKSDGLVLYKIDDEKGQQSLLCRQPDQISSKLDEGYRFSDGKRYQVNIENKELYFYTPHGKIAHHFRAPCEIEGDIYWGADRKKESVSKGFFACKEGGFAQIDLKHFPAYQADYYYAVQTFKGEPVIGTGTEADSWQLIWHDEEKINSYECLGRQCSIAWQQSPGGTIGEIGRRFDTLWVLHDKKKNQYLSTYAVVLGEKQDVFQAKIPALSHSELLFEEGKYYWEVISDLQAYRQQVTLDDAQWGRHTQAFRY